MKANSPKEISKVQQGIWQNSSAMLLKTIPQQAQGQHGVFYRKIRLRHKPVVPVGKMDKYGNIVTNHTELKKLYIILDTFIWKLRKRPSNPKMLEMHSAKEIMFQKILK